MFTPTTHDTQLFREAAEAPACVAAQHTNSSATVRDIGCALREDAPKFLTTIARGSSDHAATYLKYLVETHLGIPVVSYAPCVSSVYEAKSKLEHSVCIAISQSGKSPDIVRAAIAAKQSGARVIALVNDLDSPLACAADFAVDLHASPETAVAASKSYIASLAMIARIVAAWSEDAQLQKDLVHLPHALTQAWSLDWTSKMPELKQADSMYVVARGFSLGIAQEAALKFKETCRLHAEAFSAAEVLHGPAAIVCPGFNILAFMQNDQTQDITRETLCKLVEMGANVCVAGVDIPGTTTLPSITLSPQLQPILFAQSFYRLVNSYAVAFGCNPDAPPNLKKVTETV